MKRIILISLVLFFISGCNTNKDIRIITNEKGIKVKAGDTVIYGFLSSTKTIKCFSKSGKYFLCKDFLCNIWHETDMIDDVYENRENQ